MASPSTTIRRSIELAVPAAVAYERFARLDEHPQLRAGVRRVQALTETMYRWDLSSAEVTTALIERRPDELLRWRSVDGTGCAETALVEPVSPRRCRLTVTLTGPPGPLADLTPDLARFKRMVEQNLPTRGHHVNEIPHRSVPHPSNWSDGRLFGRTTRLPG